MGLLERLSETMGRGKEYLLGRSASEAFNSDFPFWDSDERIPFARVVQPVALFGQTSARHIAPLVNSRGRLIVDTETGLSALADTGSIAGTVAGAILVPSDDFTYEIHAFLYGYVCNGNVATRVTIPATFGASGFPATGQSAASGREYIQSSTLSLTAGQSGRIQLLTNGVEVKNLNGTVTFVTGRLGLPRTVLNDSGMQLDTSAATLADAGDFHRAVVVGRRVA